MLELDSRPCTCRMRPHRASRSRSASAHTVRTCARHGAPTMRRTLRESDEALSIALDRMIDEVLGLSRPRASERV